MIHNDEHNINIFYGLNHLVNSHVKTLAQDTFEIGMLPPVTSIKPSFPISKPISSISTYFPPIMTISIQSSKPPFMSLLETILQLYVVIDVTQMSVLPRNEEFVVLTLDISVLIEKSGKEELLVLTKKLVKEGNHAHSIDQVARHQRTHSVDQVFNPSIDLVTT